MAISLNEGSFGLLMDPMNGAADIESRTLRLVSNYGFLEEPSLLIRATRYMTRLGWEMDAKTRTRRDNAREEGVIEHISAQARSRELEQIGHEEDGLKVLRAYEAEGWMKVLFPAWTSAKADEERLTALHELAVELLLQGVHADMSAAQMRLLTAKLTPKELTSLKKLMLRPGFVEEWNSLDALAAGFAKALLAKENAAASAGFKLFTSYDPEAILWLGFTSDDPAVKERFNLFLKVWPEVRQRIPHSLLQEMRITAELSAYREIVQTVFLELLDGKLSTPEEARAFLEPHSPPAPLPKETIKRPRVKRGSEAKLREPSFEDEEAGDHLDEDGEDGELELIGGDDELDLDLHLPKIELEVELIEDSEAAVEDKDDEEDLNAELAFPLPPVDLAPKAPAGQPKPSRPASLPPASARAEAEGLAAAPASSGPEKREQLAPISGPAAQSRAELEPEARPAPAASRLSQPEPVETGPAQAKKRAVPAKTAPNKAGAKAPAKPPAQSKPSKLASLPSAAEQREAGRLAAPLSASRPGKPGEASAGAMLAGEPRPRPASQAKGARTGGKPAGATASSRSKPASTKASPKPPAEAARKLAAKGAAKSRVKVSAKAPAKAPAAKFATAKKKPPPARSSRPAKTIKPSKPATKKPVLKPGRNR